uniref:Uncharacterized protein n=1 Tax=Romanomermis culicivorax TaxID=13658 RepID=A0A915HIL2_ROMCU
MKDVDFEILTELKVRLEFTDKKCKTSSRPLAALRDWSEFLATEALLCNDELFKFPGLQRCCTLSKSKV